MYVCMYVYQYRDLVLLLATKNAAYECEITHKLLLLSDKPLSESAHLDELHGFILKMKSRY